MPAARSPQAIWPENRDAETAAACAKMAEAMLRQLPCDRPRVAAFTSPGDGDGKTSLLMALAPQLARRIAGGVLAVDLTFASQAWRRGSACLRASRPTGRR